MKLIKYLFWVLLLMASLVFLVKFNELNQFDGIPLTIKIPFLVDIATYENGFKVWLVLVSNKPQKENSEMIFLIFLSVSRI